MSLSSFFGNLETAAGKVVSYIVKEMSAAETLLGAQTGNQKLNIVVTAVSSALGVLGVDTTKVQAELKAVVDALVALFNKAGIYPTSTPPAA